MLSRTAGKPILFCIAVVIYAFLLANFNLSHLMPRPGAGLSLTFNSMAQHLLQGQYDVDPNIVGIEGFSVDGRVVAYWGIIPALLRLPLALIPDGGTIDITGLSCLAAICIAAFAKLATLDCVFRQAAPIRRSGAIYCLFCLTILFGGAQIEFLSITLYQEVCLWAGALASIFVYCSVKGLTLGRFSNSQLTCLASSAGLTLLTRVSTAIGLYAALILLLAVLVVTERPRASRLLLPCVVLGAFLVAAGFVNLRRWGNPLTFADYHLYLINLDNPDRMARMARYGLFNLARVPFGLMYYFLPVWAIARADGNLFFQAFQARLIDSTELPPGSFFLTDTLLVIFFLYAVKSLMRPPIAPDSSNSVPLQFRLQASAIAAGLGVTGLLMLCAISMTFRYRIDFYPLLEFGAFVGIFRFLRAAKEPGRWVRRSLIAVTLSGVVFSYATLAGYKLSKLGPPIHDLRHGLVAYYRGRLHALPHSDD